MMCWFMKAVISCAERKGAFFKDSPTSRPCASTAGIPASFTADGVADVVLTGVRNWVSVLA